MIAEPARADEVAAIGDIHRAAFGGDYEAGVVARLVAEGFALASLVVRGAGGAPVAHVLFSHIRLETPQGDVPCAVLAPLAVRPEAQGLGAGSVLVRAGLALCREAGMRAVVVLGDPAYYGRFGFTPAPHAHPYRPGAVMHVEFAAPVPPGRLHYPPAFTRAHAPPAA